MNARDDLPRIFWEAPLYDISGYSQISRNWIAALKEAGIEVYCRTVPSLKPDVISEEAKQELYSAKSPLTEKDFYICAHIPALHDGRDCFGFYRRNNPGFRYYIGCTMFEADRISPHWVKACNSMDEIWTPSHFNYETFIRSGVPSEKITVIPGCIDLDRFDPARAKPIDRYRLKGFTFLALSEWVHRKGWDILLRAFVEEFKPSEPVNLMIRTHTDGKRPVWEDIKEYLVNLSAGADYLERIHIIEDYVPEQDMPSLYASADAFVLPSKGEGWGLPYMEAMAMELPTIGTKWSGNLEFMNMQNSFLIDHEGFEEISEEDRHIHPLYYGCRWVIPSLEHLKFMMRLIYSNQEHARKIGRQARLDLIRNWSRSSAATKIIDRLAEIKEKTNRPEATPGKKAIKKPSLIWNAPVTDPSGYADEARNFVLGLERSGKVNLKLNPVHWSNITTDLSPDMVETIHELSLRQLTDPYVNVMHIFPDHFRRDSGAEVNVGRTMYETDRIPTDWVGKCNRMDEIWVPTEFNMETFADSGVKERKLFKVPGCIDVEKYDGNVQPLEIEGSAGFNFLSPFDWCLRKGWDVLLRAYCKEFKKDEDVALILKVYSTLGYPQNQIRECVRSYIRQVAGMNPENAPRIIFLDAILPDRDMPRLYKMAQALVMPSRCEGWGRPFMEAMAMGIPVIGTGWSGNTEFMNDTNSFLINNRLVDVPEEAWREIPRYRGHRWAEPSEEHLRQLMRQVYRNGEEVREKSREGRQDILRKYSWEKVADIIARRAEGLLGEKIGRARLKRDKRHRVVWEGEQFSGMSLAMVNRNLCYHLDKEGVCELSLVSEESYDIAEIEELSRGKYKSLARKLNRPLSGKADFHLRHRWPPDFTPPQSGRWIMIQPWEFGYIPREWVPSMNEMVDEVWVPSNYVKQCYVESGVSEEKVFVVPNGVDTENFNPRAKPMKLNTKKRFLFLFVGGLFFRKGIDVLLKAYLSAFTEKDDVCLVIKDFGSSYGDGFQEAIDEKINECMSAQGAPEIIRISEKLSDEQMAGLYRACHCLAHPYRGEGFGLPVAEAMACGLPVIVTRGGACDDFCSDDTVYYVPANRVKVELGQKTAGEPWLLEPDSEALSERMRYVFSYHQEAGERGRLAGERVRGMLGWRKSAEIIADRLYALKARPIRRFAKDFAEGTETKHELSPGGRKSEDNSGASIDELRRLVEERPGVPTLRNELGEALVHAERYEEARMEFEKALQYDPGSLEAFVNLGALHWALGQVEEAHDKFREALRKDENNVDALVNCGIVCTQTGRDEEAVELLRKYLSLVEDDLEARLSLSEALNRSGKKDEARRELQLVMEKSPGDLRAADLSSAFGKNGESA